MLNSQKSILRPFECLFCKCEQEHCGDVDPLSNSASAMSDVSSKRNQINPSMLPGDMNHALQEIANSNFLKFPADTLERPSKLSYRSNHPTIKDINMHVPQYISRRGSIV